MYGRQLGMGMIYGVSANLIGILFFGMVFGFVLRFTSISEESLLWVFRISSFLIVWIGGLIAGITAKKKGYLAGLGTAALFSLLIWFIQYLGFDQGFSSGQWMMHSGFLFTSALGGILGSNLAKPND